MTGIQEAVKIFKALANETRLRILKILQEEKELCVCKIMQILNLTQSRASRHLNILKEAGFVRGRREGAWVHYSINLQRVNEYHIELEVLLRKWLNEDESIKKDRKKLKELNLKIKNTV